VQCKQACQSMGQSVILAHSRRFDKVLWFVLAHEFIIHSAQVQSGQVGQSRYHCSGMRRRAVCQVSSLLGQRRMNLHWVLQILKLWRWLQSLHVDGIFPHDWLVWVKELKKPLAFSDHCLGGYLDTFALPHTFILASHWRSQSAGPVSQSIGHSVHLQFTHRAALNPLYFQWR
jgi:hypothetical protein